jgi:hypothetical protein
MPDEADKVVTITMVGGKPVANPDPVAVKKDNQRIKWCSELDFRITIEGYTDVSYSSGGGGNGCTFQAKSGKFGDVRNYKYSITAEGIENDPGIEVKP